MKTMRKRAAALFLAACVCTMLAGCGRNGNNAATENMTTAGETNANGTTTSDNRNNTVNGTATSNTTNTDSRNTVNGTADNANHTADENGMVNSVTAGRDDGYDGNRESGLAEIGEGVGDVGRGIIDGAENVVDDLTGNGPAERNNETNNNR